MKKRTTTITIEDVEFEVEFYYTPAEEGLFEEPFDYSYPNEPSEIEIGTVRISGTPIVIGHLLSECVFEKIENYLLENANQDEDY